MSYQRFKKGGRVANLDQSYLRIKIILQILLVIFFFTMRLGIKNRRRQIQTFDLNNNKSATLLTFTMHMKCNFPQKLTVYELSAIQ